MKKVKTLFSILFLITITFIACASNENNTKKVAQEFGMNIHTANVQKVSDYKKLMAMSASGNAVNIIGEGGTINANKVAHASYLKITQSFDKNIQSLMTKKAYEGCLGNRYNILSSEICAKGNYTVQVTDFNLDKNIYGEKEDKAGYYYEAKLKFTSTNGKVERTDTTKGYIGLSKENGQWKVSIYKLTEAPKLYNEIMMKDIKK